MKIEENWEDGGCEIEINYWAGFQYFADASLKHLVILALSPINIFFDWTNSSWESMAFRKPLLKRPCTSFLWNNSRSWATPTMPEPSWYARYFNRASFVQEKSIPIDALITFARFITWSKNPSFKNIIQMPNGDLSSGMRCGPESRVKLVGGLGYFPIFSLFVISVISDLYFWVCIPFWENKYEYLSSISTSPHVLFLSQHHILLPVLILYPMVCLSLLNNSFS